MFHRRLCSNASCSPIHFTQEPIFLSTRWTMSAGREPENKYGVCFCFVPGQFSVFRFSRKQFWITTSFSVWVLRGTTLWVHTYVFLNEPEHHRKLCEKHRFEKPRFLLDFALLRPRILRFIVFDFKKFRQILSVWLIEHVNGKLLASPGKCCLETYIKLCSEPTGNTSVFAQFFSISFKLLFLWFGWDWPSDFNTDACSTSPKYYFLISGIAVQKLSEQWNIQVGFSLKIARWDNEFWIPINFKWPSLPT